MNFLLSMALTTGTSHQVRQLSRQLQIDFTFNVIALLAAWTMMMSHKEPQSNITLNKIHSCYNFMPTFFSQSPSENRLQRRSSSTPLKRLSPNKSARKAKVFSNLHWQWLSSEVKYSFLGVFGNSKLWIPGNTFKFKQKAVIEIHSESCSSNTR